MDRMDYYLKRKGKDLDDYPKKQKREECPLKERCYRKNPHHFKEFEHPFLNELIEMGDSLVIPKNMPQPKQVYIEQLEILKPILKLQSASKVQPTKKDLNQVETDSNDVKEEPISKEDSEPSCSKLSKKVSRRGKTTEFNPNLEN